MIRLLAVAAIAAMLMFGCDDSTDQDTYPDVVWYGQVATTAGTGSYDLVITITHSANVPNEYAVYNAGEWGTSSAVAISGGIIDIDDAGSAILSEAAAFGAGSLTGTCSLVWEDNVGSITATGTDALGSHVPMTGRITVQ